MNEKLAYIIAALIIYFIGGIVVNYFGMSTIDWTFVLTWTVLMTIFDFFLLRRFRRWLIDRQNSKTVSDER